MSKSTWVCRGNVIYEFMGKDFRGTVVVLRADKKIGEIRTVEGGYQFFPMGQKEPTSGPTTMRKIKKEILG